MSLRSHIDKTPRDLGEFEKAKPGGILVNIQTAIAFSSAYQLFVFKCVCGDRFERLIQPKVVRGDTGGKVVYRNYYRFSQPVVCPHCQAEQPLGDYLELSGYVF